MRPRPPTRLRAIALATLLALPVGSALADHRRETVTLTLESGRRIAAELRLPSNAGDTPVPAVMLFGGLQSADHTLDLLPEVDVPMAMARFDYPYDPPRSFSFPGSLRHLPAARAAIFDTLEGIGALFDALVAHPAIDGERITVVGASLGAPFAVVTAARHDIPGMVAVQGYGNLDTVIAHQLALRFEPRLGLAGVVLADVLSWLITAYARLPSPEDHARQLEPDQRALLVTARDDRIIPEQATNALWTAMTESRATAARRDLEGGHLHSSADAMIERILGETLDWLREEGLL